MFILLNKCYGGFGLSDEFVEEYPEYKSHAKWHDSDFRTNEELIDRIRKFGLTRAGWEYANLSIVSIPNDVTDWRMQEYDGYEYIEYVKDGKIFDA